MHAILRKHATSEKSGLPSRLQTLLKEKIPRQSLLRWLDLHIQTSANEDAPQLGTSHQQFLRALRTSIQDRVHEETALRNLLFAGLGLAFIRYNSATQEFYYHGLFSDLVSATSIQNVSETARVSKGQGTVGNTVTQSVRELTQRFRETRKTRVDLINKYVDPVVLKSCFIDPKGRVASEDLVIGNRSFIGQVVFNQLSSPQELQPDTAAGVLFCFFPLDGLFLNKNLEPLHFKELFRKCVAKASDNLLHALKVEALQARIRISEPTSHAIQVGLDTTQGVTEPGALVQRLVPHAPRVDDPVGFLLALQVTKAPQKGRTLYAAMREEIFLNRLNHLLSILCLFPTQWAPSAALQLEQTSTNRCPYWLGQGHLDATDVTRGLYENSSSQPTHRVHLAADTANKSYAERLFNTAIELYGRDNQVVDLVVPIVDALPAPTQPSIGFIRINCILHSTSERTSFHHLYSVFEKTFRPVGHALAEFLKKAELSRQYADLEYLKSLEDLQRVVCDALAAELVASLRTDAPSDMNVESSQFLIARLAASQLPRFKHATKYIDALSTSLVAFCTELLKHKQTTLPTIVLISVWTNLHRPRLESTTSSQTINLDELLLHDHGLKQLLRLLLTSNIEKEREYTLEKYSHRDALVLPPVYDPATGEPLRIVISPANGTDNSPRHLSLCLPSAPESIIQTVWRQTCFPEPIAAHFVPGKLTATIFSDYLDSSAAKLAQSTASLLSSEKHRFTTADELRKTVPLDDEPLHLHISNFLSVFDLPSSQTRDDPEKRLFIASTPTLPSAHVSLQIPEDSQIARSSSSQPLIPGLLLACGLSDGSRVTDDLRRLSVKRLQAYYGEALQATITDRSNRETERVDALRHNLQTRMTTLQNTIQKLFTHVTATPDAHSSISGTKWLLEDLWLHLEYLCKEPFKQSPAPANLFDLLQLLVDVLGCKDGPVALTCDAAARNRVLPRMTSIHLYMALRNLFANALTASSDNTATVSCSIADSNRFAIEISNSVLYEEKLEVRKALPAVLGFLTKENEPYTIPRKKRGLPGLEIVRFLLTTEGLFPILGTYSPAENLLTSEPITLKLILHLLI